MIARNETFELEEGDTIQVAEAWELNFADWTADLSRFFCLKDIDLELCDFGELAKTTDGRFFVFWTERHPEIGTFKEFEESFPDRDPILAPAESPFWKEWAELRERMPSEDYYVEITRAEAYRLILYFWLPEEFYLDAER